jgi:hypothetical protein
MNLDDLLGLLAIALKYHNQFCEQFGQGNRNFVDLITFPRFKNP